MTLETVKTVGLRSKASYLTDSIRAHQASRHPLFQRLQGQPLTRLQAIAFLVNYDVHAGLLRRLLLEAACAMPEPAVGFILENVRNEYGNGDYRLCHQNLLHELIDLVRQGGEPDSTIYRRNDSKELERLPERLPPSPPALPVQAGVSRYMEEVVLYYCPEKNSRVDAGMMKPAITAGAVTATEIMALAEFVALQKAFVTFGLDCHPWFDHVNVESEHSEESLDLAGYFLSNHDASEAVDFGLAGTLDANVLLYDGLLAAITESDN